MAPRPRSAPAGSTQPNGPVGARTAETAVATTTVGMTNATTDRASTTPRPGNRKRARTAAPGSPMSTVSRVDSSACHTVNHNTEPIAGVTSPEAPAAPAPDRAVTIRVARGYRKNTQKNPAGSNHRIERTDMISAA